MQKPDKIKNPPVLNIAGRVKQEKKCYYPPLQHSIRSSMTPVKTDSDMEVCQACCYPCTIPIPYVDSAPIIDVTCMPLIWVLGAPGSDTSIQCKKIVEKLFCIVHISVREVICKEVKSGSKRAMIIQKMVQKGAQVPTEIVLEMIREEIIKTRDTAAGYLIDGYPRERSQAIAFTKAIASPSPIDNKEKQKFRYQRFLKSNKEILEDFDTKVRYVDGEKAEDDTCSDMLYALNPIMSEALSYKNRRLRLKKLLVGQT